LLWDWFFMTLESPDRNGLKETSFINMRKSVP